jgi:regulatory protein YycI of two-component signal transduction system YycFG
MIRRAGVMIKRIFIEKKKVNKELSKLENEIEKILLDDFITFDELEKAYTEKANLRDKLRYKIEILNEVLSWVGV